MKIMNRMTVALAAPLMISLLVIAATPGSDGYYGKNKVADKAQVVAHPFDLGQVTGWGGGGTRGWGSR